MDGLGTFLEILSKDWIGVVKESGRTLESDFKPL